LFETDTLTWSTRRIWDIKSIVLWKLLYKFIKDNNLNVLIFKVKSHSNNVGNEVADSLCKLELLETNYQFMTEIKIDASLTWEYMVYWRGILIKEGAREFMKKINYFRYKAEWLALDINRSFCVNMSNISIDWVRSLKVIMSEFNSDISELNNDKMAYNLKNYLEILPTMVLLNKRNPEIYNNSRCCRCKFMIETWAHIWICKENDTTITQIINEAFENLKIKLDNMKFKIKCKIIIYYKRTFLGYF
jgi:hypothetical protein